MRAWTLIAALLALAPAAPAGAADVVSVGPQAVSVTIYRGGPVHAPVSPDASPSDTRGLALISETRPVDLPAGRSRVRFEGVADGIIPESAAVEGLPGAVRERDFDYDLLGPGSITARSVGQTVTVVRTEAKTGKAVEERAVLRSGPDGVVLDFGGRFEALRCSGGAEGLVFDHIPPDLADKPTLSAIVDAPSAGRYTLKVSYLTVRLDWSADYVARIRPDGHTLDLTGWITLANRSAIGFADAPTAVVAGALARVAVKLPDVSTPSLDLECWPSGTTHDDWPPPLQPRPAPPEAIPAPMMASAMADRAELVVTAQRRKTVRSDLGDYKLYSLVEPTTVAAHQTKQVMFLSQSAVPFETVYTDLVQVWPLLRGPVRAAAMTELRLVNRPDRGLGEPLPAGMVGVRRALASRPERELFVGEYPLPRDVPVGEPFELKLGAAPGVVVTQRVVTHTAIGSGANARQRLDIEVAADNAMATPATVEVRHARDGADGFAVAAESAPHGLKAGDPVWRLAVPANAERVLTYTVEIGP